MAIKTLMSRAEARAEGLPRFFTGRPCKRGHITWRKAVNGDCSACHAEKMKGRYNGLPGARARDYRSKPEVRAKRSAYMRGWRDAWGREHETEYRRRSDVRATRNQHMAARWSSDPEYRLVCLLRARIRLALKGRTRRGSAIDLLGCTIEEAKRHIENQFAPGMSWENHGDWHIDHKRPISSFDLTVADQMAEACHYTNLQPLWALDNQRKSAAWPASGERI